MVGRSDLNEFTNDVLKGTGRAVSESFNTTNINGTMAGIGAGTSCLLCMNLVKYNAVPLATFAICTGCSLFFVAPAYKSLKAVIEAPFRGFTD